MNLSLFILVCLLNTSRIQAFAAAKGKGRKKNKAVVGKGFGISSGPKLEEVAAKFPNRIPPNAEETTCPCGSEKVYNDCCAPFHRKEKATASPLDVLRSRYTAFAWRMPLYVIETTHPQCRDFRKDKLTWVKDLNRSGMFDSYDFMGLDAGKEIIDGDEGFIDFRVTLRANDKSEQYSEGESIVIRENSRFIKGADNSWKYAGGDVRSEVAGIEDVLLNS